MYIKRIVINNNIALTVASLGIKFFTKAAPIPDNDNKLVGLFNHLFHFVVNHYIRNIDFICLINFFQNLVLISIHPPKKLPS